MKYIPTYLICIISILLYSLINFYFLTPRIAYVDTGKLMVGFSEANNVDKEVKLEDDAWHAQLRSLRTA